MEGSSTIETATAYRHRTGFGKGRHQQQDYSHRQGEWFAGPTETFRPKAGNTGLAHAGPLAALALHHPIALLQEALALAILALLLLLDVRALFIGHDDKLRVARSAAITMSQPRIPVYKPTPPI
jgi:hypothetical protein